MAGSGAAGFADGAGVAALFDRPTGVALDAADNIFLADVNNNRIRMITPGGVVTTRAGSAAAGAADGTGAAASFYSPGDVVVAADGTAFVADSLNNRIRKMSRDAVVTTAAGSGARAFADGTGAAAAFNEPSGVTLDRSGNLIVADQFNHRIRRITAAGVVTTLAGSGSGRFADGPGDAASFNAPNDLVADADGNLLVADTFNNRVRKIAVAGIGELAVSWTANSSGTPVTGYTATATATGQAIRSCTTTGASACTIRLLASGVLYEVSVTATSTGGVSAPSAPITVTPN